ncbi:hypothetical protein NRY68_05955 [Acidithiobacillus ferrooxidans]|uniref:hypothetical protein n=1 Tax=Acidithiobacillus ferrooxidans TaxID=920 RepID=UPI002149074F|nr:hypothetical protein [Acidithiobacillus ferrooxidans]MCR1345351.1 hypothetical protein [Acidithiobacillus ferrooxidans]MCR1354511.1 hypothetical protein [Acidithiobacillus ferrooxidans]
MNVKTIDIAELEGFADIALVVNGIKIATVDPDFESADDGSVSNMEDLALALADVVDLRVRYVRINTEIEQFRSCKGVAGSWVWDLIIPAVWADGKEHSSEFLSARPGVTLVRTDGLSANLDPLALCQRNGVRLVQAQEPEIVGMWDWISEDGNAACETSFPSLVEAAKDAVKSLGLK